MLLPISIFLYPVNAFPGPITINVPVVANNIMEGVKITVNCKALAPVGSSPSQLGDRGAWLTPIDGKIDETVVLELEPNPGADFSAASDYGCELKFHKDGNPAVRPVAREPSGAPDDWMYAKPGTPLRVTTGRVPLPTN
jgi:hypothetical protein